MARNCCRYFTVSLVPAAAFVLAVLFGFGILLLPILYTELAKNYVYGAVIDAGSSHTMMYVYRWEVPTLTFTGTSTGAVRQVFKCPDNSSQSTSLNSYVNHPKDAPNAFSKCLNQSYLKYFGEEYVPERQRKYTPIYLGATAGMRLVRKVNSTVSQDIMAQVEKALNHSQYDYKSAQILPGKQEAASGWASANYLYNNLTVFKADDPTIGALDLGGASTQIAFRSNSSIEPEYRSEQTLFGMKYDIYARSFLCYGENEAYSRFLAYLVQISNDGTNVHNPCLFSGAKVTIPPMYIYTACVNTTTATEVFGQQIHPHPSLKDSNDNITFVGTGNSYQCETLVKEMFNFCNPSENCPNGSFVPPPVAGNFVGFSAFYYTAHFFYSSQMTYNKSTGWSLFSNKVSTFCNLTIGEAKANFSLDPFLYQRCFTGVFVNYLLDRGFGFNLQAKLDWSVEFKEKLDRKTLGWALGYILEKTNSISQKHYTPERPYTVVDLIVGIIILSILCVIFIVFFFLTSYACRKALQTRSGYQNI